MESQKFRVLNRTRPNSPRLEVAAIDTTTEPFKKLIEDLTVQTEWGLWLKPYRGIPSVPGLPQFDLIYLDQDYRLIQDVETHPSVVVKPLRVQPASALALPIHTIFAAWARPGDQLAISLSSEVEKPEYRHELLTDLSAGGALKQSAESRTEESKGNDVPVLSQPAGRSGQLPNAMQQVKNKMAGSQSRKKDSLTTRFLRWLNSEPSDHRRTRHPLPGLIAYHWTGGAPQAYEVRDISATGLYLVTEDRPYVGTILLMTLQRTGMDGKNPRNSIAIHTKVVRWGSDGVGLVFVLPKFVDLNNSKIRHENMADQKALQEFLHRLNLPGLAQSHEE